jgi:hypothetical protein
MAGKASFTYVYLHHNFLRIAILTVVALNQHRHDKSKLSSGIGAQTLDSWLTLA